MRLVLERKAGAEQGSFCMFLCLICCNYLAGATATVYSICFSRQFMFEVAVS